MTESARTANKHALVIEDNEDNLELITFILQHHGFSTECAMNGLAGIEAARASLPDVILLDIQLPDIDGYAVLHRIRSEPLTANIPIVAVTSHAMSGDRERLLAAGCTEYVEKPIDPDKVAEQILSVIVGST